MSTDNQRDYSDLNHCEFGGRLAFDPDKRTTVGGTTVVTGKLPVGERYKGKEKTLWVKLVAFGAAGDALYKYHKGDRIKVRCKVSLSTWTDREGKDRTDLEAMVWEVVAASEQFAPRQERPRSEPRREEPRRPEPQRGGGGGGGGGGDFGGTPDDDGIPFVSSAPPSMDRIVR